MIKKFGMVIACRLSNVIFRCVFVHIIISFLKKHPFTIWDRVKRELKGTILINTFVDCVSASDPENQDLPFDQRLWPSVWAVTTFLINTFVKEAGKFPCKAFGSYIETQSDRVDSECNRVLKLFKLPNTKKSCQKGKKKKISQVKNMRRGQCRKKMSVRMKSCCGLYPIAPPF